MTIRELIEVQRLRLRSSKRQGIENEFESFLIAANWQEDTATTDLVVAMRVFCDMVRELQQDAELR